MRAKIALISEGQMKAFEIQIRQLEDAMNTARNQFLVPLLLYTGLLLMSPGASAQTWSAAPSACGIDEASIGAYQFGAVGQFQFAAGSMATGDIIVNCNISSPLDAAGVPPAFNTLSLGYFDPGGTARVRARLIQVNRVTHAWALMAEVDSNLYPAGDRIDAVPVVGVWDFYNYVYYVAIVVNRTVAGPAPVAWHVNLIP